MCSNSGLLSERLCKKEEGRALSLMRFLGMWRTRGLAPRMSSVRRLFINNFMSSNNNPFGHGNDYNNKVATSAFNTRPSLLPLLGPEKHESLIPLLPLASSLFRLFWLLLLHLARILPPARLHSDVSGEDCAETGRFVILRVGCCVELRLVFCPALRFLHFSLLQRVLLFGEEPIEFVIIAATGLARGTRGLPLFLLAFSCHFGLLHFEICLFLCFLLEIATDDAVKVAQLRPLLPLTHPDDLPLQQLTEHIQKSCIKTKIQLKSCLANSLMSVSLSSMSSR